MRSMIFSRYIFFILALLTRSRAMESCTGVTIFTQADADVFSTCNTITGDLIIDPSFAGNLTLQNVAHIVGSLVSSGSSGAISSDLSNITGLIAPDLISITGDLTLWEAHQLKLVRLPALKTVGSILMLSAWALFSMELDAGIDSVSNISMAFTSLANLSGINPTDMVYLDVTNNGHMTSIDLPVQTVSDHINIGGLTVRLEVNLLNLVTANNITLIDVNKVEVPNLVTVNQSLGLYGNSIDQFSAPLLQKISGNLSLWDNPGLTLLNLPVLTTVDSGIIISNNTDLNRISGLDALETVNAGGFQVNGNFVELDLPKIESVNGKFFVISSDESFNCSAFEVMLGGSESAFQGDFYCDNAFESVKGGLATSTSTANSSSAAAPISSSNSGSAGSSLSTGAKAGIGIACALAAIAVISGIILYCLKRKKPTQTKESKVGYLDPSPHAPPVSEMHSGNASREVNGKEVRRINELDSKQRPLEIMETLRSGSNNNAAEME